MVDLNILLKIKGKMDDFHSTYKNQASKLRSIKYSIDNKKQTCADMKFTGVPAFSLLFSVFSAFQVGRMALRLHDNTYSRFRTL